MTIKLKNVRKNMKNAYKIDNDDLDVINVISIEIQYMNGIKIFHRIKLTKI